MVIHGGSQKFGNLDIRLLCCIIVFWTFCSSYLPLASLIRVCKEQHRGGTFYRRIKKVMQNEDLGKVAWNWCIKESRESFLAAENRCFLFVSLI